jgi:serine/threonine-protein kinase PknK
LIRWGVVTAELCQSSTVTNSDDVVSSSRLVVAESNVLLREGLASLLERAGFDVVGQAGDSDELLALARDKKPDLVVADIRLPSGQSPKGLDVARVIRNELPDTGIVLLCASLDDIADAVKLMATAPRLGYVLRTRVTDVADFFESVERIVRGDSCTDSSLGGELIASPQSERPLAVLSSRELDVLALMAEGHSNVGISRRLGITEGTAEKHVSNILAKLSIPKTYDDHRRVLAVIAFRDAR